MIDSIYIGITGIQSHQTQLNVISNNVANINTTAYKSGRANFAELMDRTLDEGDPGGAQRSATNPLQSGLGVTVSSIDRMQTQGALQATTKETDLAISGEGFFMLGGGPGRAYTRDGTFEFDAQGRLYDPGTGLIVQGNMANADGTFGSKVEDIAIPLDRESQAKATTQVSLSGNLNATGDNEAGNVWDSTTRFGLPARLSSSPNPTFPLDLSDLKSAGLKVTLNQGGALAASTINIPPKSYAQRTDLVAELNSLVSANGTLKNKVVFEANQQGELILRSVAGGDSVSLSVDNADPQVNVASRLGFAVDSVSQGAQAAETDKINLLANVGRELTSGDVLRFSGVRPNGEQFDGSFEFKPDVSDSIQDLLTAVENVYGGVQAGLDPETGQLILTDVKSNDRVVGFDISFSLLDSGNGSGLYGAKPPYEYNTTTQVFDEKGNAHTVTLSFTKSVVANQWNWTATVDGITPDQGNNGKVIFNEDGTLRTFESADKQRLAFTPADGTPQLLLDLQAGSTDQLGGLTQFVAPSTASVREQDGRAAGTLQSVSIGSDGSIVGLFSNGTSENLARVGLASFANPAGMKQLGGNLFAQTQSSGTPVIGTAESTIQSSIHSKSLEMSNVDLAREFTDMIVTQRGFQASARSITTSDELLNEVVNLKR